PGRPAPPRAIDVLEASVAGLLDADLPIDYAGVLYSTSTLDRVGFTASAPARIAAAMGRYDAVGGTNTALGFDEARALLAAAPDTGRYVLLVSDGEPSNFAAARAAAARLWDLGCPPPHPSASCGVTIFTL